MIVGHLAHLFEFAQHSHLGHKLATSACGYRRDMAKAKYQGPSERLELYEELVASVEGVERKGAANPYTSRNGWMTSFLDKEGEVSIRLGRGEIAEFIDRYDSRTSFQYGRQMKDFVVMPDSMLEDIELRREWFIKSWDHTGTLEPK